MMSTQPNLTEQDYELLSAYLDGELNEAERAALETRLAADDRLRGELEALRQTVALVSSVRLIHAPRNYTLRANMVQPARWLIFPTTTAFSALATAAAMLLIVVGTTLLLGQNSAATFTTSPLASSVENDQETEAQVANQPTFIPPQATTVLVTVFPVVPPPVDGFVQQPSIASTGEFYSEEKAATPTLMSDTLLFAPPGTLTAVTGQLEFSVSTPQPTPTQVLEAPSLSAADNAASPQEATGGEDAQGSAASAAMADEAALAATSTVKAVEREAATATTTAMPTSSPTQPPSETFTRTPTSTLTATPAPSATSMPTRAPAPQPQAVENTQDWLAPGLLLLGILLLVIAGATTWIRIRR